MRSSRRESAGGVVTTKGVLLKVHYPRDTLSQTAKGGDYMKRLVGVGVIFALLLWAAPAMAQIPPEQRNRVTLTYAPFIGGSAIGVGLTYAFGPSWDLDLSYATASGGTTSLNLFAVGGRYHFPINRPGSTFYLGGGFASVTVSDPSIGTATVSGLGLLVGGEITLSERASAFGSFNTISGLGVGLRYRTSEQVEFVITTTGLGGISFGVSFGLPSR
jgi:hypothetical protein